MLDCRMVAAAAAGAVLLAMLRRRPASMRHRLHNRPKVLGRHKPLASQPDQCSIVSYNILCDRFANCRRFPAVHPQYLCWEYRWRRLRHELAAFGADVICLQEVTTERWLELQQHMAGLGYLGVLQDRGGTEFALAVFYRAAKLRLEWQEARSRALLVEFAPADAALTNKRLWVVNVHLEGSPYRPNDRINQLKHALQRLQLRQGDSAESSDTIICGDFNSQPNDAPYEFLKRGRLDRGHTEAYLPQVPVTTEAIAHPYALQEVYEMARAVPPFTRKVVEDGCVMDFIWCSRHLQVAAVMRPLQLELRELVERKALPNKVHPSDHLPIGAIIQWGNKEHGSEQHGGE